MSKKVYIFGSKMTRLGGIERWACWMDNLLRSEQCQLEVLDIHAERNKFPNGLIGSLKFLCFLRRVSTNADVIIQVYPKLLFLSLLLNPMSGRKTVWTEHSSYMEMGAFMRLVRGLLVSLCRIVVCQTQYSAQKFRYWSKNIAVIPPFSVADHARMIAPKSKSESQKIRLVYGGRLEVEKGIWRLFGLAKDAKNYGLNLEIVIYGSGSQLEPLSVCSERDGLASFLTIYPPVDDFLSVVSGFDGFVLFSDSESFSIVAAEALSVGVPVFCYQDLVGPREYINSGVTGVLYPRGPVTALQLLTDLRGLHYDSFLSLRCRESVSFCNESIVSLAWKRVLLDG
jgi:glycosyltransferase involved in cell wall biosynthesis